MSCLFVGLLLLRLQLGIQYNTNIRIKNPFPSFLRGLSSAASVAHV
jgi:hypothetical protein